MIITLLLPPRINERKWSLAKQVGVNYCITKAAPELSGRSAPYDFHELKAFQDDFAGAGLTSYRLEG